MIDTAKAVGGDAVITFKETDKPPIELYLYELYGVTHIPEMGVAVAYGHEEVALVDNEGNVRRIPTR